jgi:hypothetical protein
MAACHHPLSVSPEEIAAATRDPSSPLSAGDEMASAAEANGVGPARRSRRPDNVGSPGDRVRRGALPPAGAAARPAFRGIVDAYYGPPELAAAVDAEPLVDPGAVVSAAQLLLDELEDGWLRDQVVGLRTYAGVLAGESGSYADEVEGCYGVRPTYTDEAVFTAAHEELAELLPGHEPLAERYERWQDSMLVPTEQVERTVAAVIEEARAWTRGLVELPDDEGVVVEIVRDKPWLAFCEYLGGAAASPSTSTCRCPASSCSASRSTRRIPATTRSAAARSTCSYATEGC